MARSKIIDYLKPEHLCPRNQMFKNMAYQNPGLQLVTSDGRVHVYERVLAPTCFADPYQ